MSQGVLSTDRIDRTRLELVRFVATAGSARGLVGLPTDGVLHEVALDARGRFRPPGDPFAGRVRWTVRSGASVR